MKKSKRSASSRILEVRTKNQVYPIRFLEGALESLFIGILERHPNRQKVALVSDHQVWGLYGKLIEGVFKKAKKNFFPIVFPAGEASKNRTTKEKIEDYFLSKHLDRDTLLLAFGGGVVGDLAGFVAATYLRGIDFIQIPTTLLAMVDSSVGGKTAVDTAYGKNLIGAFYQPIEVLIHFEFLQTLPEVEFRQGLAEVLKYAFISHQKLGDLLWSEKDKLYLLDEAILTEVVYESLKIKKDVVGIDEKETGGLRRLLNFGHTVGHAVELLQKFKLSHGFCVAIGMAVEAHMAVQLRILPAEAFHQVIDLLKFYDLPTDLPKNLKLMDIYEAMLLDKKATAGRVNVSLIEGFGKADKASGTYRRALSKAQVLKSLTAFQAS